MDFIVLDLEWNQSNTGLEPEKEKLPFEIIEIGAVKLNNEYTMVSEFSELIKPVVYKEMHFVTSKLVHMKIEELQRGGSFIDVFNRFRDWCGDEYMFCTWGPLDLTELQRNIQFYELEPLSKGPIKFLDLQKLFSIAYEDGKSRRSLEYAVDALQIPKDIPFHRAFSDAYYAAKVMAKMVDKDVFHNVSYDVFNPPLRREEEVKILFDTYEKYISRVFNDKFEAFEDREVSSTKCYYCHRNLRKKIKWFSVNGRHYYSIAYCEKHGYLKGKIRIKKAKEDKIFVVKTTKFVSKEDADALIARREHARELKRKKK